MQGKRSNIDLWCGRGGEEGEGGGEGLGKVGGGGGEGGGGGGLAIAGQADVSASWACQQFWQADSSAGCSRLATGPGREIAPFTFVHHSASTSQR